MAHTIPIVDFSPLSLDVSDDELIAENERTRTVAEEIFHAFSTIGFVYLTNTALPRTLIDKVHDVTQQFFDLPLDVKVKCKIEKDHGWVQLKQESTDVKRPGDLRESFDVTLQGIQNMRWPAEVAGLSEQLVTLYERCTQLASRVLLAIAMGLGSQAATALLGCHNNNACIGGTSSSTLRVLHYPPLPDEIKCDQVRLGEHTDYGSFTLLFQDQIGGLQVRRRDGEWIDATPIADTVLVNIGDLLQRWTSDRLVSTPHRVLNPVDEAARKTKRQSIAFFCHPDDGTLVSCLDGSNKYEPILAEEFIQMRLRQTNNY